MATVDRYEPGTFCWVELATSDSDGAKAFYSKLFGWTWEDSPAGPDMIYTRLKKAGKDVGALYKMRPDQKGMPPNWMSYVSVASADDSAKKAKDLGGQILMGPFDVMEFGRMGVIQDPQGAIFSLWEARTHKGAEVVNEPGAPCWNELHTTDTATAAKFYTGLFGWTTKAGGDYTEFHRDERAAGGMIAIRKEWGPVPPNWLVYFAVSDCDATAKKAGELGAHTTVPPTDIEKVGRFAILADPQGAPFAVIKLTMA
jgi:uncharacterized protein